MASANFAPVDQRALLARFAPLLSLPDGVLAEIDSGLHCIRIVKTGAQVQFFFVNADGTLDGPMSRIALDRPLALLAEYAQAAMLALCWKPEPKRVCLLGLAGGRLSLVLYQYFPHLVIENVDLDPAVATIAEQYFGLTFDERQRIATADARAYLSASSATYDFIVLDAFRDDSDQLDHLATVQFYALAQARLARNGVLCANVLKSDGRAREKIKTFTHSFRHVLYVEQKHGLVLFGCTETRLTPAVVVERAQRLQLQHQFAFPFVERAESIQTLQNSHDYSPQALRAVAVLDDDRLQA